MVDPKDLAALPRDTRAFTLVGMYLQSWAVMESQLNRTLSRTLGLDTLQGIVVTRNIQMRDKINIVKSLIHLVVINDATRSRYLKLLERIGGLSGDRNTVAHDMFDHDEDGDGVRFYVTKAKGKLQFPNVRWSIDVFTEKCFELYDIHKHLRQLDNVLDSDKIARAFATAQPNAMLGGLGLLRSPNPSFRGLLDFDHPEPTPETPPETPQSSDE